MSCVASPGWYCPPLSSHPIVCPENWYCPGGTVMARRCPDGRWSAINSIYPEDCVAHMTVNVTVLLLLFSTAVILGICIWGASWEWEERDKRRWSAQQATFYGSTTINGQQHTVYKVQPVQPVPYP
jgi:hypothetical protein